MDLKTSRRLLIRFSHFTVVFVGGIAVYAGLSLVTTTSFHDLSALLTSLITAFQHNGLALLAFSVGIAITMLLLSRPLRDIGQTPTRQSDPSSLQQESLRMAYDIVRHLPNGQVFVLNQEKRYVFIEGQLAHDDPGLRQDAMIGRTIDEAYPHETSRILEALVDGAFNDTEADQELSFHARTYRISASPLPDADGQILRCLLFAQDITQLKEDRERLESLNCKLHRQATSDGLLGIANRREFERMLKLEWRRAMRERQPLSLLMIDVDSFKTYNDTYGHLKGDECLQQVASTLKELTGRPGDLVARYGGEEMAILLPQTGQEGALHIAQRVHANLAERAIPFLESPVAEHVTVSIGVASMLPGQSISAHTLIAHADEGLYAAKDNGRNRTEVIPRLRLIVSKDGGSGHAVPGYLPEILNS